MFYSPAVVLSTELSVRKEMLSCCPIRQPHVAIECLNVARAMKELNFQLYFILAHLNFGLKSPRGQVATVLNGAAMPTPFPLPCGSPSELPLPE